MRRTPVAVFLLWLAALGLALSVSGEQGPGEGTRKIVNRVTPQYPSMARILNLRGNVKAEAVVEPNGLVKSVEVKGGHPVLVRAAEDAIYKWKWAPAAHETREPIEFRFEPQ
jgi:TonB family protein